MKSRERRQFTRGIAPLLPAVAVVVAFCCAGCLPDRWPPFKPVEPCAFNNPSPDQLLTFVKAQSDRMRAMQCYQVKIKLKAPRWPSIPLDGNLALQRPKRFRLKVSTTMLGAEADFGSNDRRFWFWMKRSPAPHIFYASHEQIAAVQERTQLPFRPDWVMDALMIPRLDPQTTRIIPDEGPQSRHTLFEVAESNSRGTMRRLIWVDRCHGSVVKQVLKDERGATIATAEFSRFVTDRSSGLRMPHQVALHWPAQETSMTLVLGRIIVNPTDFAPATWTFPEYDGYTPFDMARGSMVRPAGRPVSRRDTVEPIRRVSSQMGTSIHSRRFERPVFADERQSAVSRPGGDVGRVTLSPRGAASDVRVHSDRPNFADE